MFLAKLRCLPLRPCLASRPVLMVFPSSRRTCKSAADTTIGQVWKECVVSQRLFHVLLKTTNSTDASAALLIVTIFDQSFALHTYSCVAPVSLILCYNFSFGEYRAWWICVAARLSAAQTLARHAWFRWHSVYRRSPIPF